jgi:hypothetical protein
MPGDDGGINQRTPLLPVPQSVPSHAMLLTLSVRD